MISVADIARGLLSIVAPRTCVACRDAVSGRAASGRGALCRRCEAAVVLVGDGACRGCARPRLPFEAARGDRCGRCLREPMGVRSTTALLRYTGPGRHLLRALKYFGRRELARPLGRDLAARVAVAHPDIVGACGFALVAAVPQHWTRRLVRGANQAELLARELARELGLPFEGSALRRVRRTRPLFRVAHRERAGELSGAIVADGRLVRGRWVLVIDDIRTTGSTLAACGEALRAAGAELVDAAVVGR